MQERLKARNSLYFHRHYMDIVLLSRYQNSMVRILKKGIAPESVMPNKGHVSFGAVHCPVALLHVLLRTHCLSEGTFLMLLININLHLLLYVINNTCNLQHAPPVALDRKKGYDGKCKAYKNITSLWPCLVMKSCVTNSRFGGQSDGTGATWPF